MLRVGWMQVMLALVLLDGARLPALQNWVRPLQGPKSVLTMARSDQYFSDLQPWMNQESYEKSAALVVASGCKTVGIDIANLQIEYPLMALILEKAPEVRFIHAGVENVSMRYAPSVGDAPCVVVCLDCMNDASRTERYTDFSRAIPVDKFVVYVPERSVGNASVVLGNASVVP